MFDQSFSAKNLRIISEIENRRGSNRSLEFFPTVYDATEVLKERIRETKQFRAAHRHAYSADDQAIFDDLKADRETARKARDEELLTCLSNVSQVISQKGFRISIRQVPGPKGKSVYVIPDTPKDLTAQCYYAIKQISRNISRIYKVQQANRNQIIGHLGDALSDGFPYHVIKLDVQEFYERIDHESLLSKLKADQLLSATTMRLRTAIEDMFAKLQTLSDVEVTRILTYLMAESLSVHSPLIDILADTMHTDMKEHWTPEPFFFDLIRNKQVLNGMIAEWAGNSVAKANLTETAKTQRSILIDCLSGVRTPVDANWMLRYMAFPQGSYTGLTEEAVTVFNKTDVESADEVRAA